MGLWEKLKRHKYPPDWEEKSQAFREQHNYTCEFCGRSNGETFKSGGQVRVAAAHKYPNDTSNSDPDLYCLCQSCHRSYDNGYQTDIMDEGDHQVRMHRIALEQEGMTACDFCGHMNAGGGYCSLCHHAL